MTVYKSPEDRAEAKAEGRAFTVRLIEECTRLALDLETFEHLLPEPAHVVRAPGRQWDGQRLSAIFLARIATHGVDVQYVLTGLRSQNNPGQQ